MLEKRLSPRFGPLVIKAWFHAGGERREGYLTNVSVGGAFLAVEDPPPLGADVDLGAVLPWRLGELRATARVVWRSDDGLDRGQKLTGVGLAFLSLDTAAKEILDAYLARFVELAARIGESED